ncbi:MAG: hypothetical protein A3D31_17600 [Candidatus Fluviicola riflensis]|nr:MAG: hypothetical protein CHH17_02540 [Candidatus Fluviicola riflensis]OGS76800.1 MAG: hypothetical protein A3D31_17600 [Candidatus Fluviicola riflensis]OGS82845.1 MAG: hypothetical protein A2724_13760 [Fluviicola sp. RIFCSPHIGHO2_01_FULL_43_53]OGS88530.1 MAG: hypothetical protein A3E30_07105 [Fluviicola sp. RIFCSPHIGHO2_12_FULL_43_24]
MYILIHGLKFDVIVQSFTIPAFYLAILISFSITLLLVYLIHRVTIWLDKEHDWRKNYKERLWWQFLFAFILPSLIDLGLISFHSMIMGIDFSESPFLLYDYPMIVLFILLINMYYVIRYLFLTDSRKTYSKEKIEKLVIDYNGVYAELIPESELICFYRSNHLIRFVTIDREYETRGESISELEQTFSSRGFMQINRSTIINMTFVKGYSSGQKRDTLNVIFKSGIDVSKIDPAVFIVTDKFLGSFKSRFKDEIV